MSEAVAAVPPPLAASDQRRRDEILEAASQMFASRGLRTSLQEIADACGIKPGSLYHHFESKEAIVVELIQRYHAELDHLATTAAAELAATDPSGLRDRLVAVATAVADCAARHSAAVQITFYDPPGGASAELVQLARRAPTSLQAVVLDTLRRGQDEGLIRAGLDLDVVSDRVCQTMMHAGLGLFHSHSAGPVATTLCSMLLDGVAATPPRNAELDRSAALLAVKEVIATWPTATRAHPDDREAWLRAVARTEFGRRGYEVTTVRDIAAAAGMGTGSVYRVIGSKEELLASIMREFSEHIIAGWTAVLGSDSTSVEKLDAIAWLQINVIDRFYDEFKIQLAWLRQVPPDVPNLGWSFPLLLKRLRAELVEGARAGDLRLDRPSADLTARCVVELTWIPDNIVGQLGKRQALLHARDTVLRGVSRRR